MVVVVFSLNRYFHDGRPGYLALSRRCRLDFNMSKEKAMSSRQPVLSTLLVTGPRSQSVPSSADSSVTTKSDVLGDGISGSAMAVPPLKTGTLAFRPDNTAKTSKDKPVVVSKSDTSNCNVKQVKEVTDQSQKLRDALVLILWRIS